MASQHIHFQGKTAHQTHISVASAHHNQSFSLNRSNFQALAQNKPQRHLMKANRSQCKRSISQAEQAKLPLVAWNL